MQLAVSLPIVGMPLTETVGLVREAKDWGYTAAWASEVATLLPSPTKAIVRPRSEPQRSTRVRQSASA